MKEKRYYEMYQEFYDESLNHHAERIKQYYKEGRSLGDGENSTYNHIVTKIIYEEKTNLIISKQEFSKIRLTYGNRDSLSHPDFPNRIYEKLKPIFNEIDTDITFEAILKDLAEHNALTKLSSIFSHNHQIYRMMYELGDFSEFEVNEFYSSIESTPLFIKLHKLCHEPEEEDQNIDDENLNPIINDETPKNQNIDGEENSNPIIKFDLKQIYSKKFKAIYGMLTDGYIDEDITTKEDFENVFTKDWSKHESKFYFTCSTVKACHLLDKISFAFEYFDYKTIANSKKFFSKHGTLLSSDNISKNARKICPINKDFPLSQNHLEIKNDVSHILNSIN